MLQNILAATYSERDEKVFRISCELFEEVDPEILQQALDETIERFPYYKSVLRRGIFWYYLEDSDIRPLVEKRINRSAHRFTENTKEICCLEFFTTTKESVSKYFMPFRTEQGLLGL